MIDQKLLEEFRRIARGHSGTVIQAGDDLEQAFWDRHNLWKSEMALSPNKWDLYFTWSALALMTYGHVEVIEDAFSYIPPPPKSHEGVRTRYVSVILADLLPLPQGMKDEDYIRANPQKIRDWHQHNKSRLLWDTNLNQFVLSEKLE
jgi:hypothetical protein